MDWCWAGANPGAIIGEECDEACGEVNGDEMASTPAESHRETATRIGRHQYLNVLAGCGEQISDAHGLISGFLFGSRNLEQCLNSAPVRCYAFAPIVAALCAGSGRFADLTAQTSKL